MWSRTIIENTFSNTRYSNRLGLQESQRVVDDSWHVTRRKLPLIMRMDNKYSPQLLHLKYENLSMPELDVLR